MDNASRDGHNVQTPIAVVGMACRLPGNCNSTNELWKFLLDGGIASTEVPESRFGQAGHYDGSLRPGTMRSPGGMMLNIDPKDIDAGFFALSQVDAISMDPGQQQLLEVVYEGLENAGLTFDMIKRKAYGCFVGSYASDYSDMQNRDPEDRTPSYTVGSGRAMLSNRISHFLDITGPSMTIDTACSGSLISVDLACRYLDSGDADGAIVAGNNLYMSPEHNMDASAMNSAASPSGRCWTFDARADGYIKAEAINAIILKRLEDAIRDGDPIRAVIRGSSTNSDGWTPGIASPSSDAQAAAIRRAYRRAGISDLSETAYLECHGTGTLAGDPIETAAAALVFNDGRSSPLLIGSIKSNIGHSEPAAGISGVLKTVLAIESGIIPGNPTFEIPNPAIDFEALNISPSRRAMNWPKKMKKRASVNSFGYGGSNAHAILEHPSILAPEYQSRSVSSYTETADEDFFASDDEEDPHRCVYVFSANDETSLKALTKAYVRHLSNPAVSIKPPDLAYTLSERRTRHFHRAFAVSWNTDLKENQFIYGKQRSTPPRLGFVFTGQGAQWPKMGRELIETFSVAKDVIKNLDLALQTLQTPPRWSLLDELTQDRTQAHMRQPEFSQPLVTALQLALLAVLDDWGVRPEMVVGHSSGEIAASVAAGLLTQEDAIKVAFLRGQASLAVSSSGYGMLAVGLGQTDAESYLEAFPSIRVACINSPQSVTLSGPTEELRLLEALVKDDGQFARLLQVDLAYHSEYMADIAAHYLQILADNCPHTGTSGSADQVKFYSSVAGEEMTTGADADYWYYNMVCPVRFSQALERLTTEGGADYLIELGPSGALAGPIKQTVAGTTGVTYGPSLKRGANSLEPLFDLAGRLFLAGAPVDMMKVNGICQKDVPKVIVDLPNYTWNHSIKYWHESLSSRDWRYRKFPIHDLLGSKVLGTSWQTPSFRRILRLKNVPWLRDHKVGSDIVFPAAGYIAMATEAMFQTSRSLNTVEGVGISSQASYRLRNVRLVRALTLEEEKEYHLYLFLSPAHGPKDSWYQFSIQTLKDETWTEQCTGSVRIISHMSLPSANREVLRPLEYPVSAQPWYKALHAVGFNFGPAFRNLLEIEAIPSSRTSRIRSTWSYAGQNRVESRYALHPTIIDSFFQAGVPPLYEGYRTSIDRVFVPKIIDDIVIPARAEDPETSVASTSCVWTGVGRSDSLQNYMSNAQVFDEKTGKLVFQLTGLRYNELEVDADIHQPHNYAYSTWNPDITLLSDANLDDLELAESDTRPLEYELDLPKCAAEMFLLARHKKPNMSILEVDMRSWSENTPTERPAAESVNPCFTKYAYMSLSSDGFNHAQERLKHASGTEFHIHDILGSTPPSFHDSKFDFIVLKTPETAATKFAAVVDRLRTLSAENGFLMIISPEDFTDSSGSGSDESIVNISWDHLDAVAVLQLARCPVHVQSRSSSIHIVLCSAQPSRNNVMAAAEAPLVHFARDVPELIVLRKTLIQLGWTGSVLSATQAVGLSKDVPIVLLDSPSSSFLEDISEEEFYILKQLLSPKRKLLYVSSGAQHNVTTPQTALFHGLARSIRAEDPSVKIKTLDVESLWSWNAASAMYNVISTFSNHVEDHEREYCERNGLVHINRLCPDLALIKADKDRRVGTELEPSMLHKNPRTIRYRCERIGAMDSLNYYETSNRPEVLSDDNIEIEILAASLNFKDIATSMGIVPENEYQLGLEGAGIVTKIGRNVKTRTVGQRVLVYHRGCFTNRVQTEPERTLVLPDHISYEQGATLAIVYFTVIYAFMEVMKLRKGQSVLIHSAAGGVGIAAIHFCRYIGAEIYATVGNEQKRTYLAEKFGIPRERIFSSRDADFGPALILATQGRGVDVVLNFLTGDLLDESWRSLADGGTLLEIGKKDIVDRNQLSMEPFNRNCSYRAIDISHSSVDQDLLLTARILGVLLDLLNAGHIKPIEPVKTFSFTKLPDAMRYMRSGNHMGKIVISDGVIDDVEVLVRPAPCTMRLDQNASYLIVGGLKGLCGSIAVLLAQAGAKHLIVMSRSGAEDERSKAILRDTTAIGAQTVVFKGDVSSLDDVSTMFREAKKPIRGIIHGAMVLRDRTFESMTANDFHSSVQAKHRGTQNLHKVSEQQGNPLDFFTLLSSISGVIGMAGQANYSAANVYQDAFAAYRHGLGLKANSINLGVIEDVGYLENNHDIASKVESRSAFNGIDERTLLKIVTFSILQQIDPINSASVAQTITGLPSPLAIDSPLLSDARFSSLVPAQSASSSTNSPNADSGAAVFVQMVNAKLDTQSLVNEAIRLVNAKLVKNLGLADDMEPGKSLNTYGIDSLAAVDLRNWLRVTLKAELTTLDILNASSLLSLCEKVVGSVLLNV